MLRPGLLPTDLRAELANGPALASRECPPDVPVDELQRNVDRVRRWLGSLWLAQRAHHPLRALWRRRDWLATNELYSLGVHLRRLDSKPDSKSFLSEVQKHAIADDPANRTGRLWELCAASMFDHADHPTSLAKKNQPGFDFSVHPKCGPTVRISCKALNPSVSELEFRDFSVELQTMLQDALPAAPVQIVMALARARDDGDLHPGFCTANVLNAVQQASGRSGDFRFGGGWYLHVRPLETEDLPYWNREPSYSLVIASEYPKDEQRRFGAKLVEGVENLRRHCGTTTPEVTNAIALKVPAPISMQDAESFVAQTLTPANRHVAAVYLYRTQVAGNAKRMAVLGQEFRTVVNPHAAHPSPPLKTVIPVGTFLPSEPRNMLFAAEGAIPLDRAYVFSYSRRCHVAARSGDTYSFSMNRRFIESLTVVLSKSGQQIGRVDCATPESWTVLL